MYTILMQLNRRAAKSMKHQFTMRRRIVARMAAIMAAGALAVCAVGPVTAYAAERTVDFSYVEQDIANWEAVYCPVLDAKSMQTAKQLPARQSKNLDVTDAAGAIYGNLTDTIRSSSVLKTQRALMLYDVLSGNYSQKAVALFLDHGYFTEYYKDLRAAGLVEDSYRMPAKAYATTVLRETVTVPDNDGVETTYRMIKTDSSYLDTEQLRTVALSTKDKKTARSLEKKIASFEEDFTPKAAVAK